ncbi:MAG: BTAD domain-containing putative transcriptional regulator [Anaerolineae bacterium]|jgi:ATP/maltotriose-dependent transcriptional regulator MalT/DNA-binding SARP family transcriptional activator
MPLSSIVTKIRVPSRSLEVLHRERLVDFLHENIDRRLIIVSAPAGYGKTTLLVDFAHETDLKVCWYTLDPTDRDPHVFLEHLLASLAHRFPDFGEETRRVLDAGASLSEGGTEVVGTLVNEMVAEIPEWFVLVLDDFHRVEDAPDVTALLTTFLNYQPEHCHLFIASRTVPNALPFISLAARGEVVGLGQDVLRFTPREVQALFRRHRSIQLSRQEAEGLARESEGWITGILLTSHALQRGTDIWARARASGRPIYDYLAGEVLDRQDQDLQEFLLTSSTLEEMSPDLCEQALGLTEAEKWLRQLERRNLFAVRLAEEEETFRYHALFREFLQTRLEQKSVGVFRDLHRRAAAWFEGQDEVARAAGHYLAMGEPSEAARVIDQAAQDLLRAGHLKTLIGWAERVPANVLRSAPRLALSAAKAASRTGRLEPAMEWLDMAEAVFRERGGIDLLAMAVAAQALIRHNQGRYEDSIQLAEEAISLTSADQARFRRAAVEARRVQGICLMRLAQYDEAQRRFQTALEENRGTGDVHREVLIRQGLAWCLHSQGRLEEAVQLQRKVVNMCRRLGSPGYLAGALNDLAYNLYHLGEYTEALESLREALETARRVGHRYKEAFALVSLGEVLRDLGDPETAAEDLTQGLEIARELDNAYLSAYGREALGLAHLRLEDGQRALELTREAVNLAEQQGAEEQVGRYQATLGLIQVEVGDVGEGLQSLRGACALLKRTGAEREIARARLFLAHALHRSEKEKGALRVLGRALGSYLSAGLEHRLLVEGEPALLLLEKAAAEQEPVGRQLSEVLGEVDNLQTMASRALREWEAPATAAPPSFRAYGFGIGRVERDGAPIPSSDWPTTTARHLFFYLLSHASCTREQIGVDLWPDLRPSRLSGTFHNTKYRLQQALGVNPVVYEEGLYSLCADLDVWYDVLEFERLLERARRSPQVKAARYMRKAIALYTGAFLEECYAEWCIAQREALRRRYLEAVGELGDWLLSRRRLDEVIPLLRQGLEVDNLREDFHRRLMRAYVLDGRPEEAIAQYRRCVRILRRELDVEPEPRTQQLANAIREGRFPLPED